MGRAPQTLSPGWGAEDSAHRLPLVPPSATDQLRDPLCFKITVRVFKKYLLGSQVVEMGSWVISHVLCPCAWGLCGDDA